MSQEDPANTKTRQQTYDLVGKTTWFAYNLETGERLLGNVTRNGDTLLPPTEITWIPERLATGRAFDRQLAELRIDFSDVSCAAKTDLPSKNKRRPKTPKQRIQKQHNKR